MARIVDLTVTIENCMPSHRTMPRPIYRRYLEHEEAKALTLGTPEDPFTSAIEFISMLMNSIAEVKGSSGVPRVSALASSCSR